MQAANQLETGTPSRIPVPLQFPDFRALWSSTIATGFAFTGERVVIGWILLDRSDSPFFVGLGIAVSMIPNLLLGVPSGVLADRYDRRLLMKLAGAGAALNAGLLATLGLIGDIAIWQVLLLTFIGGCSRTVSSPARQTYAFDVVGSPAVVSAMALLTFGQRLGGIAGALLLGTLLAAYGESAAFICIGFAHLLGVTLVFCARSKGQAAPAQGRAKPIWQGFGEYLAEMRSNRTLFIMVVLTASVEALGFSYQALLPSIARDRLEIGAGGLGLLNAVSMGGGLAAILLITLRGELEHKGFFFLGVLQLFGLSLILLGHSWTVPVAIGAAVLISSLAALSDLLTQSLVQASVPNELRGRAMGSWSLAIGLGPLGSIQLGALAAALGVTVALTVNGAVLLALGTAVMLLSRRLRGL